MTKKFLFYAFAAMTAMCMTACGSDDENEDKGKKENQVNLPTPPNAENAKQFQLVTPKAPESLDDNAPRLTTIDITESNDVLLELKNPKNNDITYVRGKVTPKDRKYEITGDFVFGTIEYAAKASRMTRAGSAEIILDLNVMFGDVTYTYKTENGKQELVKEFTPIAGNVAVDRLTRTWDILGLILDLKGETNAFESWEAKNGVLDLETTILKTALERKVSLTEDEKNELRKKLQSVILTKSRVFTLNYIGGSVDAASWEWTDETKMDQFRITLKDGKMGNKFIQNASLFTAEFNGDRCNLKLATTFTDNSNKTWNAIVTLQLKSQD